MTKSQQSPLLEAQASSLDELFRRDPIELSDDELDQLIDTIRQYRGQAEDKRAARSARAKALESLSIDDDLLDRIMPSS